MARIHQKRLEKRYGKFTDMKDLMSKIIDKNSEDVTAGVMRINNAVFAMERGKIKGKEKSIVLPDVTDIMPPHVRIRKAAERGELMTANLRAKLTENLRDVLANPDYIRKRGKLAGTLKESAVADMQASIIKTFEGYTKTDPKLGVPPNVRNIAVTEVRAVINPLKDKYINQLMEKNDDITVTKTFIHNARMSKKPREHHREMNGVTRNYDENFEMYDKENGLRVSMPYPHHESLPASEVIGCSCECQYRTERIKPGMGIYKSRGVHDKTKRG